MNNDAENELTKFEAFLADTDNQTKEETLAELADNGVNAQEFLKQIQMVVREGYSKRLKEIAEREASAQSAVGRARFGDVVNMSRETMLAVFERLRAGDFGEDLREATFGRCRNRQTKELSDEELRSWLEDISDIPNE